MMARLESTMQNIADTFGETKRDSLATQKTFITYNRREKTIATVKKRVSYPISPYSLEETPENCFYLQLKAARELLESYCEYELSEPYSLARHLEKAPDLLFLYHPALGPLYSVIRQKIKRGKIAPHSEIQLHLSDLALFDLSLNGSLQIYAENPIGHFTEEGRLVYSEKTGRCLLRHVKIENEGIDWELSRPFWKNQLVRKQSLEIILEGCSEFAAIGVHFAGNHRFIVPDGQRMEVSQKNGLLCVEMSAVPAASLWRYETQKRRVCLAARDFSAS
jgi:hypothetical protein